MAASGGTSKMLKKDWLMDKDNLQNLSKIDIGAGAQIALKELNLFPEKTRKFKADCRDIIQSVILKFVEKTPLKYNFVRLSSALVPKHIVENREKYSNRFRLLVDGLSASKKVSSPVADKAKFQYNEIQTLAHEKHYYTKFSEFNYQNDHLDVFLGKYFSGSKELWHVSELIFVLLHGQSFIERGFSSVNRQLMETNTKEKSLVSQRIVYDKITSNNISISSIVITPELRKSCMLASQRYNEELKKAKEEKVRSEQNLKRKAKCGELKNVKGRKADLQTTINALRDSIEQKNLSADKNQDLSAISKAAALLRSVKEKEKTL